MLAQEYSIILRALMRVGVTAVNIFFDASAIDGKIESGKLYKVGKYFNKRFYKFTETNLKSLAEMPRHEYS